MHQFSHPAECPMTDFELHQEIAVVLLSTVLAPAWAVLGRRPIALSDEDLRSALNADRRARRLMSHYRVVPEKAARRALDFAVQAGHVRRVTREGKVAWAPGRGQPERDWLGW